MLPNVTQAVYRVRNTAVSNADLLFNVDWSRNCVASRDEGGVASNYNFTFLTRFVLSCNVGRDFGHGLDQCQNYYAC